METQTPQLQEKPQKKIRKLTKKQRGFLKDYIETGNGTQAALKNYDIKSSNPERVASVIAAENLTKPSIIESLPDSLLVGKHLELFEQKRVDYFVFPKNLTDDEIVEHVRSAGIEVITVRATEKGKMAFYSMPDSQAIKGGLEMAYKIKGTYAPEKSVSVNVNVNTTDPKAQEIAREYEEKLKQSV